MLTHANLSINVQQAASWFPAPCGRWRGALSFASSPSFMSFAMTGLMNFAISMAAQMIMLPRFELKQALKLIDETKPTIMAGVPTLFNALAKAPDIKNHDLSSLKFCISGGAPLPLEVKREFERVSGCKLVEGYGLSETSPVTHINPAGGPIKEGSIGLPVPGTIMSLRELGAPGRRCRLARRARFASAGPQVMKGYWNKPQRNRRQPSSGEFFRTGDVAYMDERRLHVHRRPHQGPHSLLGLQRLSAPDRGGDLRASGRGGSHRDRRPRQVSRRSAEGFREASRRRACNPRPRMIWNS